MPSNSNVPPSAEVRYELRRDPLMGTYTIVRTEVIGVFATRDEARQHMLDTEDQRREGR